MILFTTLKKYWPNLLFPHDYKGIWKYVKLKKKERKKEREKEKKKDEPGFYVMHSTPTAATVNLIYTSIFVTNRNILDILRNSPETSTTSPGTRFLALIFCIPGLSCLLTFAISGSYSFNASIALSAFLSWKVWNHQMNITQCTMTWLVNQTHKKQHSLARRRW